MEFAIREPKPKVNTRGYDTILQLYKCPPSETISLKEFDELAEQRLKMLQKLENLRQRAAREGKQKEDANTQYKEVLKEMPLSHVETPKVIEDRRRDHISHYILRLAYCRTEDMRRWFLSLETELLRTRFLSLSRTDHEKFFKHYKDDFSFAMWSSSFTDDDADRKMLYKKLINFYDSSSPDEASFYMVPFTEALDLVQTRRAVVNQGYVYIPVSSNMIVSFVCNKFRQRLSAELLKTRNHLPFVDDDERVSPMLKNIRHRYLGEDFSNVGAQLEGSLSLSQIDSVSKESFPPCMRHLHDTVRKEHHLRHFGRLQYGLFLKSIGLTLEQALTFWRTEFVKKVDAEKFEKNYAYNIRHNYGKEGKRANYTPYSCMKIIMSNAPAQGDHHGCPFRHWDESHVMQMLTSHGVSHKGVHIISNYVKDGHYQLACQRYFEITHAIDSAQFSLEHPTQYYKESRELRGHKTGGVKTETTPTSTNGHAVGKQVQEQTTKNEEDCYNMSIEDIHNFEEDVDMEVV